MDVLSEIDAGLSSSRVGDRLRALDLISRKSAGRNVRVLDDRRVVTRLEQALADPSLRVRRAAARGLRTWVTECPALLDDVLPLYAANVFDGSFSHAGLYDTVRRRVWVPRWAGLKGHAALLRDGDSDRYFKFEFFVPGQVPRRLAADAGASVGALVLHLIPEWSYRLQELVPDHDWRRRAHAQADQCAYGRRVVEFYAACDLDYDVAVFHLIVSSGQRGPLESVEEWIHSRGGRGASRS